MSKKEGEMSSDMADFIKRKRQSETESVGGAVDEKERKRQEIMKRVAERRKQRELEGAGTKAASAGASKLNEELKRKDAEHQKEVFEMRKTIEDLRNQISQLQASSRNAEQLKNDLEENSKKMATIEKQLSDVRKEKEDLVSRIDSLKTEHENQLKALQKERDVIKADKNSLENVVSNLKQQVESLTELQKSEVSSDDKISQLTEELNGKNNELSVLKKMSELAELEKEQMKQMLEEQEDISSERDGIIKKMKEDYNHNISLLQNDNSRLVEENKELKATLSELSAVNSELQEALDYEKSVVESQEIKIREQMEAQVQAASMATASVPSTSSPEPSSAQEPEESKCVRASDSFEAALVGEINLLRKNPDSYADYLVDLIECYNGLQFKTRGSDHTFDTKEGVNALEDAIEYLQSCQHSCPHLVLKEGLCQSAQYLCDQNGPAGSLDANCVDGTSSSDRLVKYGQWKGRIMELMSFGPRADSPRDIVTQWLIDDGNSSRSQRTTLLDFDFKVAGVGHSAHKDMTFMTVLAMAKSYKDSSDTTPDDGDGDTKSSLNESEDKNFYVIRSEPCRVPKSQIALKLDGKVLHLLINSGDEDKGKKSSHQWNLPFGVPACNIKAKYNECSEVEIYIDKRSGEVKDGEQEIYQYKLPVVDVPNNRLKLQVVQKSDAIVFTTNPCSCAVDIAVKIIDGMILCFESVYTEASVSETGATVTKTVTRREKVNMPYNIFPDRVSFEPTDNQGMIVSVSKPTTENAVTTIPIA